MKFLAILSVLFCVGHLASQDVNEADIKETDIQMIPFNLVVYKQTRQQASLSHYYLETVFRPIAKQDEGVMKERGLEILRTLTYADISHVINETLPPGYRHRTLGHRVEFSIAIPADVMAKYRGHGGTDAEIRAIMAKRVSDALSTQEGSLQLLANDRDDRIHVFENNTYKLLSDHLRNKAGREASEQVVRQLEYRIGRLDEKAESVYQQGGVVIGKSEVLEKSMPADAPDDVKALTKWE